MILGPQEGPQTKFLASDADIVIYGGAAGGGKSVALAMELVRNCNVKDSTSIVFRRIADQLEGEGGIWDLALEIFPRYKATMKDSKPRIASFPSGATVRFSHMQHEKDRHNHQGKAYSLICFDEVQHFTKKQFTYLMTRNRSKGECEILPYVRCTCNPVSKHDKTGGWLRELIDWWIGDEGYPIEERDGVKRYYIVENDEYKWVDEDWQGEEGHVPTSITFIASKLSDNPAMKNPKKYMSTLLNGSDLDKEQLLNGNWNITESGGMFKPGYFQYKDFADLPRFETGFVRYWDIAATETKDSNKDPDWAAGALINVHDGNLYIFDMDHFREEPGPLERRMKATASKDGKMVSIAYEQEPGASGKAYAAHLKNNVFRGFVSQSDLPSGDKATRAKPWAARAEQGKVYLVRYSDDSRNRWHKDFLGEAYMFPFGKKDQIDAVSGGFKLFINGLIPKQGHNGGLF